VDTDFLIASIQGDAAAMIAAAGIAGLAASVPTCPGWTVLDLLVHTGVVHRHKAETVRGGYVSEAPPPPGGPEGVIEGDRSLADHVRAVAAEATA